jgi:hypothetical protein
VWKNPSRTHGCSENEEFYCRKGERDFLLYQVRGGSEPEGKGKGKAVVYFRSFLRHLKLRVGERLHVIPGSIDL